MLRFFFTDPGAARRSIWRESISICSCGSRHDPDCVHVGAHHRGNRRRGHRQRAAPRDLEQPDRHAAFPRDILRSKLLASLWRLRGLMTTLLVLWTIGLMAGAIHPLGFFLTLLELAAWTWLLLVLGLLASVRAKDRTDCRESVAGPHVLADRLRAILPFLLPARMSSVLLGPARHRLSPGYRWCRTATSPGPALHGLPASGLGRHRHRRGGDLGRGDLPARDHRARARGSVELAIPYGELRSPDRPAGAVGSGQESDRLKKIASPAIAVPRSSHDDGSGTDDEKLKEMLDGPSSWSNPASKSRHTPPPLSWDPDRVMG